MGDVEKVMMTLLMTIPKVIFSRTDAKNIQLEKLQRSVKGRFWPSFFNKVWHYQIEHMLKLNN